MLKVSLCLYKHNCLLEIVGAGVGNGEDKTNDYECEVESFKNSLWPEHPPENSNI